MINLGEDELICDLAEVYSIYDYKSYPAKLIATLAAGLGDSSRIKQKEMGISTDLKTFILAIISDNLSNYIWARYGSKGNAPSNLMKKLLIDEEDSTPDKYKGFSDENALREYLYKGD